MYIYVYSVKGQPELSYTKFDLLRYLSEFLTRSVVVLDDRKLEGDSLRRTGHLLRFPVRLSKSKQMFHNQTVLMTLVL